MSPSDLVRAAPHPSVTTNSLSSKRRQASAGYLLDQGTRIRQIRSRARKERELVCKLRVRCTAPSARHLLKQALQTVDIVDRYFLSKEFLRERKAPAQLSRWFDFVEQCLEYAVKKREFYESMLERYCPTDTLLLNCQGRAAKAARQPRSAFAGATLARSQAENCSSAQLKVQTAGRSCGRGDNEVVDSRLLTVAADAISVRVTRAYAARGGSCRYHASKSKRIKSRLANSRSEQ